MVEHISHRIAVMYHRRMVELADESTPFERPLHPYAEALLSAVPDPDAMRSGRIMPSGDVPGLLAPLSCHCNTRCPYATVRCRSVTRALRDLAPGHWAACHLHDTGATRPLARPVADRGNHRRWTERRSH